VGEPERGRYATRVDQVFDVDLPAHANQLTALSGSVRSVR
jgi:hypothetical protein